MAKWRLGKWPSSSAIIAITVLALAIRVYTATWTGMATDEANGIILATTGSLTDVFQHLKEDGNAPLLSVLIRVYALVFGHDDASMKIFAIVLATAQVPLSYLICRQFLPRGLSLQVAAMIALCATLVTYSTMIRPYAIISLLGLLSTWLCMEVLRRKSIPWAIAYGITNALLVYGHYWGGFAPLGQAVLVLIGSVRRWFDAKALRCWLLGAFISVLLFAPWMPTLIYQLHHDLAPWLDQPQSVADLMMAYGSNILAGPLYTPNPGDQVSVFLSFLLLLSVLILPRSFKNSRFDGQHWKIVAIASYSLGLIASCFVNALRQRYLTVFTPLFAVVYITSASMLLPQPSSLALRLLPLLVWLPLWLPRYIDTAQRPETSTPAIASQITRYADRAKDLVIITSPTISPAVTFYLPNDLNVITLPDLERRNFNRWDTMLDRLRNPKLLAELFDRMQKVLDQGGKVWLIERGHDIHLADFMDESRTKYLSYFGLEAMRSDQLRTWLSLNAAQIGNSRLAPGRDFDVLVSEFVAQDRSQGE